MESQKWTILACVPRAPACIRGLAVAAPCRRVLRVRRIADQSCSITKLSRSRAPGRCVPLNPASARARLMCCGCMRAEIVYEEGQIQAALVYMWVHVGVFVQCVRVRGGWLSAGWMVEDRWHRQVSGGCGGMSCFILYAGTCIEKSNVINAAEINDRFHLLACMHHGALLLLHETWIFKAAKSFYLRRINQPRRWLRWNGNSLVIGLWIWNFAEICYWDWRARLKRSFWEPLIRNHAKVIWLTVETLWIMPECISNNR